MGSDKSLMEFHGKPQREYLFDLLTEFCSEVYLSCKDCSGIPERLNPLQDQFDIDSPLNGILSAFLKDTSCAWLTVAVDMPLIDAPTLQYLVDRRDPEKVATCFLDSDGQKPEPLLTLWEPKAFPMLQAFHNSKQISPRDFLLQHDIGLLSVPDRKILTNINSPDDLTKYNQQMKNT